MTKILKSKEMSNIKKEVKHLQKTGIPRCHNPKCRKEWVHDIDSITKKISKYSWKPNCKCIKKPIRMSIG